MRPARLFQAITLLATAMAMPAKADDNDHNFYIRTGPATLFLSEDAKVKAAGARIPGGTISIDDHSTGTLEFGYQFTPNLGLGFTGGFPPTVDIYGAGTLTSLGKFGSITYGPTALALQYTFTDFGRIKPYVGAGPMFMFVFNTKDAALDDLKVKSAIGATFQAGVDLDVTDRWGFYLDVKKAYLRTKSTGSLGGVPISTDVKLDPLVIGGGIKVRF